MKVPIFSNEKEVKLQFQKPLSVETIGSFATQTITKPFEVVDVCIEV